MKHFRIRKHDEMQHYKDRQPPWIKLHQACLSSYRFLQLPDNCRWQALGLALIASRCDNHLPADPKYLKEALHSTTTVDLDKLLKAKFIEWCSCEECAGVCSDTLASCKQSARPEKRREEGEESRGREEGEESRDRADAFARFWESYPRKVGKRKAEAAFDKAIERGLPDPDALAAIVARHRATWDDPKFIPYPATWLNRDGWLDEVATPPADDQRVQTESGNAINTRTTMLCLQDDLGIDLDLSGNTVAELVAAYERDTGRCYADDEKAWFDNGGSLKEAM